MTSAQKRAALERARLWLMILGASMLLSAEDMILWPVRWWQVLIAITNAATFCLWLWQRDEILNTVPE